ncbi:MAG: YeeE/YedE family protein [Ignavibacteriales bacterium]|nr:YeeE/YedE family protein [Ignavibacteriales bacterium]
MTRIAKPYMNPYVAGIGLGLVLLLSFVVMGRGLGASGAFTSVVAVGVKTVAPAHAQSSEFYQEYLPANTHPLKDWLVFEVAGVIIGGFISGSLAGRTRRSVDRGPNATPNMRLTYAFFGGALIGFGSKLARGCTSGQALTGGAVLSLGSWIFMIAVFVGAYAVAYVVRRQWT